MSEKIKLYLDEDTINWALIHALRSRNVDVVTAQDVDLKGIPDPAQLDYATSVNRVIFTFNTRDFVNLHRNYLTTGKHHAGIIVSDQIQVGLIVRRLLKLLTGRTASQMRDWLEFLSNWQ